ncbi:hypothetical protein [Burkholderia cepacia]|uniref:hypothetical protein n=1 Tax=Burkholderia cepacia TaxID=292 RepID=UPI001F3FD070|nr:hypothetical protein [Burkholderia cepacia]UIY58117.1 hypothetical protein LZ568_07855 [Burkholderia cepacia]
MDDKLKEFATDRQREILEAVERCGSQRAAAEALGISHGTVSNTVAVVERKAARAGYSPAHDMTHVVPPGFVADGISTYYNVDGKPTGQWVKARADKSQQEEVVREMVRAMTESVRGLSAIVEPPSFSNTDLLAVYPFGDPHVGLYVWAKECGEDFDLEIGRKLTMGAVDRVVSSAPSAETAILLLLGDVFHADDSTNRTPAHQHPLDVDSRYVKVLQVGIETYRYAIIRALEKHHTVIVKAIPGNHDPHAIWALAFTLSAYFSNNPRVEVDLSPAKHWYFRFGSVLIGATHGDTVKHEKLGGMMACDRAQDWGETLYRYWYTGHIHSRTVTELPGVVCESFRTLAAQDAYAAGHGYRAGRDMMCIVHHREYGEIERHRADIGMLEFV